jgi:hypothetical protein
MTLNLFHEEIEPEFLQIIFFFSTCQIPSDGKPLLPCPLFVTTGMMAVWGRDGWKPRPAGCVRLLLPVLDADLDLCSVEPIGGNPEKQKKMGQEDRPRSCR